MSTATALQQVDIRTPRQLQHVRTQRANDSDTSKMRNHMVHVTSDAVVEVYFAISALDE
jgi:hypothetical protein